MTDWDRDAGIPRNDLDGLPASVETDVPERGTFVPDDDPSPSEAFQLLASEVRVRVLVRLLEAERSGAQPCSFTALQEAAGGESSAGFAYHLRQLSGHFLRKEGDGYALTPAGRRAARAIVDGTFTRNDAPRTAS